MKHEPPPASAIDITAEALKLAKLIGEPMPHVHDRDDLLAYADHVGTVIHERAYFDEQAVYDVLGRLDRDRQLGMIRALRQRFDAGLRRQRGLKAAQALSALRSKQQGDATRARVHALARQLSSSCLPSRDHAALIAKRLGLSARQVRRLLRER